MALRFTTTITNVHVERYLAIEGKRTGKTPQDYVRDMLYVEMMSKVKTDKNLENKIWGKQ